MQQKSVVDQCLPSQRQKDESIEYLCKLKKKRLVATDAQKTQMDLSSSDIQNATVNKYFSVKGQVVNILGFVDQENIIQVPE